MTWNCAAIDHGITIFPNGKIGPCCQVRSDYLKPISMISNPDRFSDLKTECAPPACEICNRNEHNQLPSYRTMFNRLNNHAPGLQFVDIRNTNLCNLKCRYCGPHFSSQWADEFGYRMQQQDISEYKDVLITDSLHWMYFTGGEPLINPEHWDMLEQLISQGRAKSIALIYSSNLTTIKYKDKNIIDIWRQFKTVDINVSVDTADQTLQYIRSGADWNKINHNIQQLINHKISVTLAPVISILNIWFVKSLFEYARDYQIPVKPIILEGPDYLALSAIPDQLKSQALDCVAELETFLTDPMFNYIKNQIENNQNQCLFNHTVSHVLLLDKLQNEQLFDLLPFGAIAKTTFLRNYEYQ